MEIREFLLKSAQEGIPILDVRSPGEFLKGHIPGSINIPIFDNEQRAELGITYKKEGKIPAILLGLEIIGPELRTKAEKVLQVCPEKKAMVHCWRGGMRSASFAELLKTLGFEVYTLSGGYKRFRNWGLSQFTKPYRFKILGGFTGSGKTDILHDLSKAGEQILDLEKLACHLGSAFGTLGVKIQPSQEQFENELAVHLSGLEPEKPIWIEDESRTLGKIGIPTGIWEQMRLATLYKLELPLSRRRNNILRDYQGISIEFIEACIYKITKRLGGLETKNSLEALREGNQEKFLDILLQYYDRTYQKGQNSRPPEKIINLAFENETHFEIAQKLIQNQL